MARGSSAFTLCVVVLVPVQMAPWALQHSPSVRARPIFGSSLGPRMRTKLANAAGLACWGSIAARLAWLALCLGTVHNLAGSTADTAPGHIHAARRPRPLAPSIRGAPRAGAAGGEDESPSHRSGTYASAGEQPLLKLLPCGSQHRSAANPASPCHRCVTSSCVPDASCAPGPDNDYASAGKAGEVQAHSGQCPKPERGCARVMSSDYRRGPLQETRPLTGSWTGSSRSGSLARGHCVHSAGVRGQVLGLRVDPVDDPAPTVHHPCSSARVALQWTCARTGWAHAVALP